MAILAKSESREKAQNIYVRAQNQSLPLDASKVRKFARSSGCTGPGRALSAFLAARLGDRP
jgi:hypothetical protein